MRRVAIGIQSFEDLRKENYFYIDKTNFIKEWWESGDAVTLIARPRRFGKTLNMSMLEQFFSQNYAERGDLFEGLSIWAPAKVRLKNDMRKLLAFFLCFRYSGTEFCVPLHASKLEKKYGYRNLSFTDIRPCT